MSISQSSALEDAELEKKLATLDLRREAVTLAEQNGIVFIDEIDKLVSNRCVTSVPDVRTVRNDARSQEDECLCPHVRVCACIVAYMCVCHRESAAHKSTHPSYILLTYDRPRPLLILFATMLLFLLQVKALG